MPHLKLLDKASNRAYRVESADAVVGRDPSSTIPLQGDKSAVVSSRHARFIYENGVWWVEDLSSRNGTFHNSRRLPGGGRQRLTAGDELSFGSTGPKLYIEEVVGHGLASTLLEAVPAVPMRTVADRPPAPAPAPPASAPLPPTAPEVPAAAGAGAKAVVRIAFKTGDGKRMVGQDLEVVIGRSREASIRLEGDMSLAVSRRHARIFYSGWKVCIEDLGSRNGTWLNRKRVERPTIIERGDVVEFGAGGPMLTVTDVALLAANAARKTEMDMKAIDPDAPFISELPTPAVERPALKDKNNKAG
jgi:pSer/pThr/pTyr-binding forkhead associated (FHA) protein